MAGGSTNPPGHRLTTAEVIKTITAPTPESEGPGHSHKLPRSLLVLLVLCLVGLLAGIVLVSVQAYDTNQRLSALEDYAQGKGEERDQQNAELNARIDEAIRLSKCDMLDRLPANSPLLDPLRAEYGCGPGVPFEQLPPAVQQNLSANAREQFEQSAAAPGLLPHEAPPSTESPAPFLPSLPPAPSAAAQAPATANPAPSPTPTPTPPTQPRVVDLNPITDPVCNASGICL